MTRTSLLSLALAALSVANSAQAVDETPCERMVAEGFHVVAVCASQDAANSPNAAIQVLNGEFCLASKAYPRGTGRSEIHRFAGNIVIKTGAGIEDQTIDITAFAGRRGGDSAVEATYSLIDTDHYEFLRRLRYRSQSNPGTTVTEYLEIDFGFSTQRIKIKADVNTGRNPNERQTQINTRLNCI
jgi:hypothetical protein